MALLEDVYFYDASFSAHFGVSISSADWKFAAEQFVKRLPGKVYVHCELNSSPFPCACCRNYSPKICLVFDQPDIEIPPKIALILIRW